jgi:hypothetical protein
MRSTARAAFDDPDSRAEREPARAGATAVGPATVGCVRCAAASRYAPNLNRFRLVSSTRRPGSPMISRFSLKAAADNAPLAGAARPALLMTALPFVPVEGQLAYPSLMPFSGLTFGREWTRLAGRRARLRTVFIDVNAPHRACQWQPARRAAPAGNAAGHAETRPARPAPDGRRRALHAACYAAGALGFIGWLVWSQTASHETAVAPLAPAQVSPQQVTRGVIRSTQPSSDAPASPRAPGASQPRRASVADSAVTPHHPAARPRQTARDPQPLRKRATRSPVAPPVVPRTPPRAAPQRPATRQDAAPAPIDADVDAWRDLDAALYDRSPAAPAAPVKRAPTTSGEQDWTQQLNHRRLTDAPERFVR